MAVREVLPEEYDELDQKLEKELPLSICVGLFNFKVSEAHLFNGIKSDCMLCAWKIYWATSSGTRVSTFITS